MRIVLTSGLTLIFKEDLDRERKINGEDIYRWDEVAIKGDFQAAHEMLADADRRPRWLHIGKVIPSETTGTDPVDPATAAGDSNPET